MWIYLLLLLWSLTNAIPAQAEVYKYADEHGAVSFTDDLGKIPQEQRQIIEQNIEKERSTFSDAGLSEGWMRHPLFKYILAFIALAIFMLFIQSRTENFLLRLVVKLLFVGFLGAAIYNVFVIRQPSLSPPSFEKSVEPYLPSPAPIRKAQEAVKQVEEGQKKEEETINSLLHPEDNK